MVFGNLIHSIAKWMPTGPLSMPPPRIEVVFAISKVIHYLYD